jgi:hypothetical protein
MDADVKRAYQVWAEQKRLAATERLLPGFRYWTIAFTYPADSPTYPGGAVIRQGAYADRYLAHMNAQLNEHLSAEVRPVYDESAGTC